MKDTELFQTINTILFRSLILFVIGIIVWLVYSGLISIDKTDPIYWTNGYYFPGLGYNILEPFRGKFYFFRNIGYIFICGYLGFIGVLLALNKNQDKTSSLVVLPKIIFLLIIFTFSYVIAGLVVDITTWMTNLINFF